MVTNLLVGDCLKVMDDLIIKGVKVDCVITDPPYELDYHCGSSIEMDKRSAKIKNEVEFIANGFNYDGIFNRLMKICKVPNFVIFCSNKQISTIMSWFEKRGLSVSLMVWKKPNPSPLCNGKYISDLEYIVYVRGKGATFNNNAPLNMKYKCKEFKNPTNKIHPTQKPIDLMEDLITVHSLEGQTVLDPFMGSGSTGVACKNLDRNFIGIELDEHYYNIAKNRISSSPLSVIQGYGKNEVSTTTNKNEVTQLW